MCGTHDNRYKVEFLEFTVTAGVGGREYFRVCREPSEEALTEDVPPEKEEIVRHVKYSFPSSLLKCNQLYTRLRFCVGPLPVPNLRMIERHYFKNKLVREYDMMFGFCIPSSTNTWEAQYDMPLYDDNQVTHVGSHHSDSFYFVQDELIIHNKATYTYYNEDTHEHFK